MQTALGSDALSRFGCALSDPTRAEILLILRDGPGYPSELAERQAWAVSCPASAA